MSDIVNIKSLKINSLFRDKTTLILRELLATPQYKWRVRSLAKASHTSLGLVSRTISTLARLGWVETAGRGRGGFILLKRADALLDEWTQHYRFAQNSVFSYFLPTPGDVRKICNILHHAHVHYALTLHSGADLLTHYFMTDHQHIYINSEDIEKWVIRLSGSISIQRLAKGGNLHLISPYYTKSVFDRMRFFRHTPVVSNLQLYLDLFHFMPRGHEHAMRLREILGDKLYE